MSDPGLPPRPAVSVLVVRDAPLEVLMAQRNERGMFGSALVFPGGSVDEADRSAAGSAAFAASGLPEDERARRIAAVREVWEETGIALAAPPTERPATVDAREALWPALLGALDGPALDGLRPFARWITPLGAPRRWDTSFYLAVAPAGQEAREDGSEILGVEWCEPAAAAALGLARRRRLVFPTIANLLLLAESGSVAAALDAAESRPSRIVLPEVERSQEGRRARIPADSGYPLLEHFDPI